MPQFNVKKIARNTKASLNVATLNIKGRGDAGTNYSRKWNSIHGYVRDNKIGILAVQETHMSERLLQNIHDLYGRRLKVLSSTDPSNPNSNGVAFVLNKQVTNANDSEVSLLELIPGRAIMLTTKWHDTDTLRVLNVYAPNNPTENENFWLKLSEQWRAKKFHNPDILLGDFNIVDDPQDRIPNRPDRPASVTALQSLTQMLQLKDGWRERFQTNNTFTFPTTPSPGASLSRIDRIYLTTELIRTSEGWQTVTSHIPTDHKLVSVLIAKQSTPYIGRGRWSMPVALLRNPKVNVLAQKLGILATKEMEAAEKERTEDKNPQTIYENFKKKLSTALRNLAKKQVPEIQRQIDAARVHVELLTNSPAFASSEADRLEAALLLERIRTLEESRFARQKDLTAAKVEVSAETASKTWVQMNKIKAPRDVMYSLRKLSHATGEDQYERRSNKMAEIAMRYHDQIQDEKDESLPENRDRCIDSTLSFIETKLSNKQQTRMGAKINESDLEIALLASARGKASGLDGIPYEFWLHMHNIYRSHDPNSKRPEPWNVAKMLTLLFNDIETHGTIKESSFTDGWMCPIYKKKGDRRDIANHRPITLLNTDYKILTKILAIRLAEAAPSLIHKDQAGFIPGRSILDQIHLCRLMFDYAECKEENGVIVALDQEKAYDKIDHQYLWQVLAKFEFPSNFITLIKTLYREAHTAVAINGVLSAPFRVRRGVRQGDPMSCILFDLAIEPLASMLRKSEMRGFKIPGQNDRLITTLFADDTTVYLSEEDSYEDLWNILSTWCSASLARFNMHKTKIIPIGREEYRKEVVATRKLNVDAKPIPSGQTAPEIIPDGKATRILGAQVGSKLYQSALWQPIVAKIETSLANWAKSRPSFRGKQLITQWTVGGMTQYFSAAQGMPRDIEEYLEKITSGFIWDGKKPKVAMKHVTKPVAEGGLDILDIQARNEAIALMRLKSYLNISSSRPRWAFVADAIMETHHTLKIPDTHINGPPIVFLHKGRVKTRAKTMPKILSEMISIAGKYNVKTDAIQLTRRLQRSMPVWQHIGTNESAKHLTNAPAGKCLRSTHGVYTVGSLFSMSKRSRGHNTDAANHMKSRKCTCKPCTDDRKAGCSNPIRCQSAAERIINSLSPKWSPLINAPNDGLSLSKKTAEQATHQTNPELIPFNPMVTTSKVKDIFWVFSERSPHTLPAHRPRAGIRVSENEYSITVESLRADDGHMCVAAILNTRTRPVTIKLKKCFNDDWTAQAIGIVEAIAYTSTFAPLTLWVSSKKLVEAVTSKLKEWEAQDWAEMEHPHVFRALVSLLRRRSARTWILGENRTTHPKHQMADVEARLAGRLNPVFPQITPDPIFLRDGILVKNLSQASAYRRIMASRVHEPRGKTTKMLDKIKAAYRPDLEVSDKMIWTSFRHKAIAKKIQSFLWKVTNDALSCGEYWSNIPNKTHLRDCPECKVVESPQHIISECKIPGRSTLWQLAAEMLKRKGVALPTSFGGLLGCAIDSPIICKAGPGAKRLRKIIISETIFLIWKLRCERRMAREDDRQKWHSTVEASERWYMTINKRLNLDKDQTRPSLGKSALPRKTVLRTWGGLLHQEYLLQDDWTREKRRVLVGRGPPPDREFSPVGPVMTDDLGQTESRRPSPTRRA